jgi:exopolysaccharide biosynthesis polyprenyl glycosylphosphotransferase
MSPPSAATRLAPANPATSNRPGTISDRPGTMQDTALGLAPAPKPHLGRPSLAARLLDVRAWWRLQLGVDLLALCLASWAALITRPAPANTAFVVLVLGFPLLTLTILHARRTPDERLHGSALDTVVHVLGVVSLAAMTSLGASTLLTSSRLLGVTVELWLLSFIYLATTRTALLAIRRQAVRNHTLSTPTLIVGAGVVGEHLVRRLLGEPRYGLRPVGFIDSDPLPRSEQSDDSFVPLLGDLDDLVEAVDRTGARHVILAFSTEPDRVLVEKVKECVRLGIEVSLVPRLYESINERATLDYVGGLPLLTLRPTDPRGWQFALKHALDRSFALIALIVLAPLMGALALAVRLTSPGPVLFRQRRVGRDGHVFDVLKFRTMREDVPRARFELAEGCAPGGIEGDDRRTPIGRLLRDSSLDELPQLINVLRGDMSLVGPRPERPEFVERFSQEVARYEDRHRVRSGITGWAQVHGLRGQTSIADRVEWDNYYIQNWSLRLDLRILALTLVEVLRYATDR